MNKSIFYILLLTALPLYFTGCRKEVRPTSMTIKDSVRHYYPIKQGQQLDIMFTITNTGDAPLIISEMQPSCGCIILDKSSHIIIAENPDAVNNFAYIIGKGVETIFGNGHQIERPRQPATDLQKAKGEAVLIRVHFLSSVAPIYQTV